MVHEIAKRLSNTNIDKCHKCLAIGGYQIYRHLYKLCLCIDMIG